MVRLFRLKAEGRRKKEENALTAYLPLPSFPFSLFSLSGYPALIAEVVELADTLDSESSGRKLVRVRLPPSAPFILFPTTIQYLSQHFLFHLVSIEVSMNPDNQG